MGCSFFILLKENFNKKAGDMVIGNFFINFTVKNLKK